MLVVSLLYMKDKDREEEEEEEEDRKENFFPSGFLNTKAPTLMLLLL